MTVNRSWIGGVLLFLICASAHAQHWSFRKYGVEAGLTNPTILALHQDKTGFLWVSTEGGLFQYDGDRFRSVEALVAGRAADVTSLHTSFDGQVWAGSLAGLFRWTGKRFEAVAGPDNLELDTSQALASDSYQVYAAATSGLWSFPLSGSGKPRQISAKPANSVRIAHDGTVWFGCGSALCSIREGKQSEWTQADGLPDGPWSSIAEDGLGRLWIRSDEQVLVRENGRFRPVLRLSSTHHLSMNVDKQGRILIPHSGGLEICGPQGCRNYGVESGLEHSEPLVAEQDREGSLWIGYSGHGLARWLGREEWQSFAELEGLSDSQVWRIVRDTSGKLWLGTNRGLFEGFQKGGSLRFRHCDVIGDATVYALMADPDGSLWIGTFRSALRGLVRFDPKTRRRTLYPPATPIPEFALNSLSRDNAGDIWMIGAKQVFRLNRKSRKLDPVETPLSHSPMYSILHAGNTMYVCGRKGLYIQDGQKKVLLTAKDGLKDTAVQSVAVGPSGELWITYFAPLGISRLDWTGNGQFTLKHYAAKDGLTSDMVYFQFFDSEGRHWLGTDHGAGVLEGNRWVEHDTSDGLVWNDCNAQAFLSEPHGVVWLGTSAGMSRYAPATRPAPTPSPVLITSVTRNDVPVNGNVFDSNMRSLVFRYTVLAYQKEAPLFRYRLSSTEEWITTYAHEVHFAELPPRTYRFEVQAELGRGGWSSPAVYDFTIQAPWFRSPPFLATAASSLAGLIWLWWRARERHQRKLRQELEAAVAERTRGLAAATARAEQESRFKGEFLANMSHEMRTPLNGVLGLTKLALELSHEPEVVHHLNTVQLSAKVLLSLINDILDLAKIEAGMMEIVPVPFQPRLLLEEVCSMLEPEAKTKQLQLELAIESTVPAWIEADDCRLRQVLVNLIGNAIKFTQQGEVKLCARYENGQLMCSVQDTGIGITPSQQAIIFDVFRQADNSTSRRHGGSGLGLAISLKLVKSMGGSISVESEPGSGSIFSFHIQAPITAPCTEGPAPQLAQPGGPMHILVAEDNKVNQQLLLALLKKRGHSAVVANNGHEALAAYERQPFDLILMDIQMPQMDGIEAVQHIRKAEVSSGARIPVVVVTARAMPGDRDQILAAGMDSFLEKPIRTEQLDLILSRFAPVAGTAPEEEKQVVLVT